MKIFRSMQLIALLCLMVGISGFSGCKKEEDPVVREAPKKRAAPVEEEPAVDPIDPQRIEQAMKVVVEPDPPEMTEEPAEMKEKDEAVDPKKAIEEEEEEEGKGDAMEPKHSASTKHVH